MLSSSAEVTLRGGVLLNKETKGTLKSGVTLHPTTVGLNDDGKLTVLTEQLLAVARELVRMREAGSLAGIDQKLETIGKQLSEIKDGVKQIDPELKRIAPRRNVRGSRGE